MEESTSPSILAPFGQQQKCKAAGAEEKEAGEGQVFLDMARLVRHISFVLRSMCLQRVLAARVGQGEVKGSQPAWRRSVRGGPRGKRVCFEGVRTLKTMDSRASVGFSHVGVFRKLLADFGCSCRDIGAT